MQKKVENEDDTMTRTDDYSCQRLEHKVHNTYDNVKRAAGSSWQDE